MRVRTPLVQANAGEGSGNGLREHAILSIVAGEITLVTARSTFVAQPFGPIIGTKSVRH